MTFTYNMRTDYRPIPPGEQGLQSVTAEKFHLVTREKPKHLEGICFDKYDNMYFTSTYDGKAYRLDMMTKNVTCVWYDPDLKPVSVKLHRDGRLFISCLGTGKKSGRIVVVNPDGSE